MQVKSFTKFSAKSIAFGLLGASASVSPSIPAPLCPHEPSPSFHSSTGAKQEITKCILASVPYRMMQRQLRFGEQAGWGQAYGGRNEERVEVVTCNRSTLQLQPPSTLCCNISLITEIATDSSPICELLPPAKSYLLRCGNRR